MAKVLTALYGNLALLPYPAEALITETLEWLTDTITSRNGTEQRLQVRNAPRQNFDYLIPQSPKQRQSGFITERGALRERWAIPVWSQSQPLAALAGGELVVPCDTTNFDLRADSLALLYESPDSWQLVEIDTVGATDVTLSAAADAFATPYLIPVRVGFLTGASSRTSRGDSESTRVHYQVDDNVALSPAEPAQYLGQDIYYEPGLFPDGETYTHGLSAREDVADFDLGLVARFAPWVYTRHAQTMDRITSTPAEHAALRNWLHRRAGKYRAFWQPSFEQDLRLTSTGTLTTLLSVHADDYLNWGSDRTHLAFEDTSGNWYPRAVTLAEDAGGGVTQITLDSALNLDASAIRRISFLGLRRLANDAVTLEWLGGGVCRTQIATLELTP